MENVLDGDYPMGEAVIAAVIGLIGSGIGSLVGIIINSRLIQYRLEQLEQKVHEHNNLVTRMYSLEDRMNIGEEKQRVANHRIDDLEQLYK